MLSNGLFSAWAGNPGLCGPIPTGVPVQEGHDGGYDLTQVTHKALQPPPSDKQHTDTIFPLFLT
jgi:hypothetical protein